MWAAAPADNDLRRNWADPSFEPSGWEHVEVPGHWRDSAAFASHDGPLLYHRTFEADAAQPTGTRRWLELDGVFSQGDVWLDGSYLGNTDGYFLQHRFEVTDPLAAGREHTLAIEVTSSPVRDPAAKRDITGPWLHGSALDPDWNPGGLWRPVRLRHTGPVACRRLRVLCTEAGATRAVLSLDATLDAAEAGPVVVCTTVAGTDHRHEQPLAAGSNRVRWTVVVEQPALWWPRMLGDQPLHDLEVAIHVPDGETAPGNDPVASDVRHATVGFRTVAMRNWIFSVNGERLFLKGASMLPTRQDLAAASPAEVAADVDRAVALGLDLLRVHAHIARPELYEAADRAGILLWQDLPLQGGYNRSVRRQAIAQARAAVDLLGHHPSLALWCGHDEPFAHPVDPAPRGRPSFTVTRLVAAQELPTWNRSVLDRSVRRALSGADPSRPVVANSGVLPHPPQLDGTASHFSFGWHHGDVRDLALAARAVPRVVRFVSRLGAPAVPDSADFCATDEWPTLDWERLERHHGFDAATFSRRVPPAGSMTFDDWRLASQRLQAELVQRQVELLRRLKYRPTGGVVVFALADAHPSIGWGLLDHARIPKLAYAAMVAACAPVIVVADLPPRHIQPGDEVALDVHVVSDARQPITGATVHATLQGDGIHHEWVFAGDIASDTVVRVGEVRFTAPEQPGLLVLELTLHGGAEGGPPTEPVVNRYEVDVGASSPSGNGRNRTQQ